MTPVRLKQYKNFFVLRFGIFSKYCFIFANELVSLVNLKQIEKCLKFFFKQIGAYFK